MTFQQFEALIDSEEWAGGKFYLHGGGMCLTYSLNDKFIDVPKELVDAAYLLALYDGTLVEPPEYND